ncbi:MAG TPA: competence/damage-inducible protein A [Verrucomicrobiae bacterium]|nr:competence/damage-inducible protein A [Verrucomicrobiae bacterium]
MNIELINTGSELLLGRVLNTHQQWICRRLADLGSVVARQVAVPDTARDIQHAVREALGRADLVIVTGGLGPTSDDITRDLIAQLLGKKLVRDKAVFMHIKNYFAERKRPMPPNNDVQAMVPEGAIVLANPNGTAPGLAMRIGSGVWDLASGKTHERSSPDPGPQTPDPRLQTPDPKWLIMLPGPPRELHPMFNAAVVPLLQREFPLQAPFVCRTLRTGGIGESAVQDKIKTSLDPLVAAGLEVGYCARVGQVDVRLTASGSNAADIVREAEAVVQKIIGANIYGFDDETIEENLVRQLSAQKQTLALAESCTGGGIANRITNVPGASEIFLGGVVSYSNAAKETLLGVSAGSLAAHGAVSETVAREMAVGAREKFGADFAIAVTGIAGPGGGTVEKPVGTVFIALAGAFGIVVERRLNLYERAIFKELTGQQALEMLRIRLVSA